MPLKVPDKAGCLLLAIVFFMILPGLAKAQSTSADSIKAVVTTMFIAMKNADPVSLRSVFADSALLQSVSRTPEAKTIVKNEPLKEFIDYIGKQPVGASDERIEFESVLVNGALASVWTPYKFYFNGQLQHCGVNSFQLVRIENAWKIQYIIDTRIKEGCEE
jgi:hypothetical protein